MKPSVAARLYAGAVDATPMTRLDSSPSAPDFRPFPPACAPSGVWAATEALSISPLLSSLSRQAGVGRCGARVTRKVAGSSQGAKALKVGSRVVQAVQAGEA